MLWVYIRAKGLQNPKDKRQILLDEPGLRDVFKVKSFTMFTMNRHLSKHLWEEETEVVVEAKPKKKAAPKKKKAAAGKGDDKKAASASKKPAKPKNPVNHPVHALSPSLAHVVGAPASSRPGIVKAVWAYIRAHNLQDPSNRSVILCDAALKKVMGGEDKVTMFSMNKFFSAHVGERVDGGGKKK